MMRLICTVASVYLAVSDDLTVPLEEACDAGDQECALSFRQLRGQQVKAFKDPEDPCKSAEPMTGIAERWDFCALNEKHCTNCKGAWCLPGNITYYDGTKYKPGVEYEPISDQRLTAENHTATQEAEEEVANDDSLDDLFPDGLADTAHDLPKDAEEPEGAEGAEDEDEPPPFA
ncbi:unnamed protein product [Cladocopium goreaui]|uniref:Gastricsin n=1 Tax=Cladocopium goreaui TaxID=2562237 RepID=A0A9P1CSR6_9DINO|nr:unnamed protein product [Cladocopium goreaui]